MGCSYFNQPRNVLVAQIKLFSCVCKVNSLSPGSNNDNMLMINFSLQGVNKECISKIVKEDRLATTEEAHLCIKDEHLHPALRSAYIDFIISTLVDVNVEESGTTVGNYWLTFVSLACMQYFTTYTTSSCPCETCLWLTMLLNDQGLE